MKKIKLFKFIIVLLVLTGCHSFVKRYSKPSIEGKQADYLSLKKELEEIHDIDQQVRNVDWDTISSPEANIAYSMKMMAVDSVNQTMIIPILEHYGWIPKSKVGEKAARAIYYVVQHSNSQTIEKYLPQMEALAKIGEASATDAATMRDRLLSFQGKKQIYGTQAVSFLRPEAGSVIWPIEDTENVNKRRKEAGFTTTVEENAKRLGAIYDPNEQLPQKNNATQQ